jgi:hypothetical protein
LKDLRTPVGTLVLIDTTATAARFRRLKIDAWRLVRKLQNARINGIDIKSRISGQFGKLGC